MALGFYDAATRARYSELAVGPLGAGEQSAPLKVLIRADSGLQTQGNSTISVSGDTADRWALAPDTGGGPGVFGTWGQSLTVTQTITEASATYFWVKARGVAGDAFTDRSVSLCATAATRDAAAPPPAPGPQTITIAPTSGLSTCQVTATATSQGQRVTQTFTASMTGVLQRIRFPVTAVGSVPMLVVEIGQPGATGYLGKRQVGTAAIVGGWLDLYFPQEISLTQGVQYEVRLYASSYLTNGSHWDLQVGDSNYAGGVLKVFKDTVLISSGAQDMVLEVYQVPVGTLVASLAPTGPSPSGSNARSVGTDSLQNNFWVAQTFIANASGTVSRLTFRANGASGSPSLPNMIVQIRDAQLKTVLGTAKLEFGYYDYPLDVGPWASAFFDGVGVALTAGTTYGVVWQLKSAPLGKNVGYTLSGGGDIGPGLSYTKIATANTWNGDTTFDLALKVYVG